MLVGQARPWIPLPASWRDFAKKKKAKEHEEKHPKTIKLIRDFIFLVPRSIIASHHVTGFHSVTLSYEQNSFANLPFFVHVLGRQLRGQLKWNAILRFVKACSVLKYADKNENQNQEKKILHQKSSLLKQKIFCEVCSFVVIFVRNITYTFKSYRFTAYW